jgi:hypothetical protein
MAACTTDSDSLSSALVASSSMRIEGFFTRALRAMDRRTESEKDDEEIKNNVQGGTDLPRNRDTLLLSSTKLRPAFADGSFVGFGKSHNEVVRIGLFSRFLNL